MSRTKQVKNKIVLLTDEENAIEDAKIPTAEEQVIINATIARIAEKEAARSTLAFKGMALDQAKAYSNENSIDLAGQQKINRKIITAILALHPTETE